MNLADFQERHRAKYNWRSSWRVWTTREDRRLKQLAGMGWGTFDISDEMCRSRRAIWTRAAELGIEIKRESRARVVPALSPERAPELYREVVSRHAVGSIKAIALTVSQAHGIGLEAIKGQSKCAQVLRARHEAIWLAARDTDKPYTTIARFFGDRNHTTILHAVRRENFRRGENVRGAGVAP